MPHHHEACQGLYQVLGVEVGVGACILHVVDIRCVVYFRCVGGGAGLLMGRDGVDDKGVSAAKFAELLHDPQGHQQGLALSAPQN